MDTITIVSITSLLAGILYWLFGMGRAAEQTKRRAADVSFGSINSEKVKDKYNQYSKFFRHLDQKPEQVADFVNVFYDLITDMYEYLWGQSFHFSPSIKGKTRLESTRIHEEMLADLMGANSSQKILDVGCGVGGPMRAIAAYSGSHIVGITINEYQVTRAKAYNEKAGLDEHCEVVCGNFLKMPFEDESFDGAYSIEATCHAPKLEDVYREIFRVLKPGSMYVSYEWVTTELYNSEDPEHVEIIHGIEIGNALPRLRRYSDIAEVAKRVGFEVVKEKDLAKPPAGVWWSRLRKTKFSNWKKRMMVMVLEKLGFVAKGTGEVQEMLLRTIHHLARGGETGIFTPMHMILCRKPEKQQQA
ncbi:putative methyltransferase [Helianthus anomalus]